MNVVKNFNEYKIFDMAHGEKLESWNGILLRRPDPQIIWNKESKKDIWLRANAIYHRSKEGGGYWEKKIQFLILGKLNIKN